MTSKENNKRVRENGFTFAEVLATLMFLAILIPVVTEALNLASRTGVVSERSAMATELAENRLNELALNSAWVTAEKSGDFGTDWPGYRWELSETTWSVDSLTELTIHVFFDVQGKEREISMSTVVKQS
jgi:hypothetical protein